MKYNIDTANYADLKTLEDRVRRTLYAHGFNENTSTPLGDMNSLCRNLVQDAAATDAELAALQARLAEAERERDAKHNALADQTNAHFAERIEHERRLAESEAQRAVLVAALEHIRGAKWDDIEGQPMIVLGRTPSGLGTSLIAPAEVCRQALATQPPSDLVALVKATSAFRRHEAKCQANQDAGNLKDHVVKRLELLGETYAALDALLTNQPGFRALIDREDV